VSVVRLLDRDPEPTSDLGGLTASAEGLLPGAGLLKVRLLATATDRPMVDVLDQDRFLAARPEGAQFEGVALAGRLDRDHQMAAGVSAVTPSKGRAGFAANGFAEKCRHGAGGGLVGWCLLVHAG